MYCSPMSESAPLANSIAIIKQKSSLYRGTYNKFGDEIILKQNHKKSNHTLESSIRTTLKLTIDGKRISDL